MSKDDLEIRVERYNTTFKKWPKMMFDKGWMYGVWYCPRAFQKQTYYGQYPLTYLKRVRCLFEDMKPLLHLFSGIVKPEEGEATLDIDHYTNPTYCGNAEHMLLKAESISCIVADPPYSKEHATNYKHSKYPSMKKVFSECSRVLITNGYLCFLHTHLLSVPKKANLKLRGVMGILTGTNAVSRVLAIYRKEI